MSTELLAQAALHERQSQWADAEGLYRRALAENPTDAEATFRLGALCNRLGRLAEAGQWLEAAARLAPRAEVWQHLGIVRAQQGQLDAAVACLQQAARLHPTSAEIAANLRHVQAAREQARGMALAQRGETQQAMACFRRALELRDDDADLWTRLGAMLSAQGDQAESVKCCQRAVDLRPDVAETYYNLSIPLFAANRVDEAIASCRRAVALKPGYVDAMHSLAVGLFKQHNFAEAIATARRALAVDPDREKVYEVLADSLIESLCLDEAIACYREILRRQPDFASAHLGLAIALLLAGQYAEGWSEYEWRAKVQPPPKPDPAMPAWNGEPLGGKTILVRGEQGIGDTLQFARYAALLAEQGGHVVLECGPALASLMTHAAGISAVTRPDQPWPRFDAWVPLLSLPRVFGTTVDTIPPVTNYLTPTAAVVEQGAAQLAAADQFKIGIAWQGNPQHIRDGQRSIPLARFAPLLEVSGAQFYSLQFGPGREQLLDLPARSSIVDLGDRVGDFHHLAGIIRNLDLVICCDSSPAHLAGSLGVETWLALAHYPDWRWLLARDDSPWYPSMRLFRQTRQGVWEDVFARMKTELLARLARDSR